MNAINGIKVQILDADGLAKTTEPGLILLDITRQEVEASRISSVLERLHVLTDSEENMRRFKASLMLQVRGYDSDSRELCEIPEVRAFFLTLVRQWPHFLWFLHRGVGAIGLLMALLCEVMVTRNPDGSYATEFANIAEMERTLLDLINRGAALFVAYQLDPAEVDEMFGSVITELGLGEKQ